MGKSVLFPLMLGVLMVACAGYYRFVPLRMKGGLEELRRPFALGELLGGVYCFVIVLLACFLRLEDRFAVLLTIIGMIAIFDAVVIPQIVRYGIRKKRNAPGPDHRAGK